ncbi:hypothetical protein EVAR_99084_1 [Eumeta japonica]|uniref:Uncharacterized protein n=1 Tax=Eumeta variegata TaxID=151549 RepID=A0A4C1ZJY5_EUMVA|nr:hypothetical protein EVAR_99084_1 [Eumeta japonica]
MPSLQSMCGLSGKDRCRNSGVRERCGLKEHAVTRVARGMLRWFGRRERMNVRRLTKQICREDVCDGKVGEGRPRKFYADYIQGEILMSVAFVIGAYVRVRARVCGGACGAAADTPGARTSRPRLHYPATSALGLQARHVMLLHGGCDASYRPRNFDADQSIGLQFREYWQKVAPPLEQTQGKQVDQYCITVGYPGHRNVLGLVMEPEGRRQYSIMKRRSLTVFGLVDIVVEYTLTMISFQSLITELEVWKLYHQTLKVKRDQNTLQGNSNKPKYS